MIEEGDICCDTLVEWDVLVLVRATVDHGGGGGGGGGGCFVRLNNVNVDQVAVHASLVVYTRRGLQIVEVGPDLMLYVHHYSKII